MRLSAPVYRLKRRAKVLARDESIALHEALDRIARDEGFAAWSLLSASLAKDTPSRMVLTKLSGGDLLLLAARPGHGKTLLGLQLLLDAAREGRRSVFFTLDLSERQVWEYVRSLDADAGSLADKLEIVTSDDIGADFIIRHLAGASPGTVAIIDYLQILDQQRSKPVLSEQMLALRDFARTNRVILGFISQIDRSFDPESRPIPDLRDIRLPNAFDLGLFSKACFLHDGEVQFQHLA
jgi:replicative DNA helicase